VGEGEAGFPLSRQPNAGLYPRTPGSRPELKADRRPTTEPPRRPYRNDFVDIYKYLLLKWALFLKT